jgi:hypothetical protein
MKKILTVSLCSMLAVCAANAEIASVDYVDDVAEGKQNTISDLATIRSGAALGATAAQNLGDLGVTATATELNYVDGVTSNIQTQLNAKQAKLNYTAENTANKVTSVTSTSTDTQYPSAKAMYTALAGKQASLGYTAENTANKTQTIDANSTATQYPSAKAVKTALDFKVNINQGTDNAGKGLVVDRTTGNLTLTDIATQTELNSVSTSAATNALAALDYYSQDDNAVGGNLVGEGGKYIVSVIQEDGAVSILTKDYVDVITDETKVAPTSNAVYDALAGKVNVALGSGAASKAVITDASGNITTGTITSALIANSTITNNDIASNAAIAQSKISGLTTSLAGKQNLVSDGVEGKFYVADYVSGWKDMFEAMPKNERCSGDDVKCSLTHKNGKYYWEIVRE